MLRTNRVDCSVARLLVDVIAKLHYLCFVSLRHLPSLHTTKGPPKKPHLKLLEEHVEIDSDELDLLVVHQLVEGEHDV